MKTYTIDEAAGYLRKDKVTLCNLVRRRKIGYYKGRPVTFSLEHLTDYQKSIEVKPCVANPSLSNLEIPPTGLSNITPPQKMEENEASAFLRGTELARKTMKQTLHLPHSH